MKGQQLAGPRPNITIATTRDADDIRISVEDDGPVVSEEDRNRIFEWFTKGEHSSESGLGLAFCRLVAERHDGRIWVKDGFTGGARSVLTLPLPQQQPVDEVARVLPGEPGSRVAVEQIEHGFRPLVPDPDRSPAPDLTI